jgi:hypothetical protein
MTVMYYYKEFNQRIWDLLLKSSILSCMDMYVLVGEGESTQLFFNLIMELSKSYVVPIEIGPFKIKSDIDAGEGDEPNPDSDNPNKKNDFDNTKYIYVRINSVMNKLDFEYKKGLKYSEFEPILNLTLETGRNEVPILFSSIVTSNENNDNFFFFDTTEGNLKIFARPQNNHKLTNTFDFRKLSEIEELKVDENIEHFVFWMDRTKWVSHLPTEIIELPKKYPNLKSVTFRDNIPSEFEHNPVQRFIGLGWDWELNVEFGAKGHETWYVYDKFHEFYMWDSAERELKGVRFDEFILIHPNLEEIIKMENGYYWLDLKNSSYLCIKNLKIAFSFKHEMGEFPWFGVGFKEWCEEDDEDENCCKKVLVSKTDSLTHKTLKNHIFVRPSIDSCYWMSDFARSDEFDLLRKQKEGSKEIKEVPKEEK